MLKEHREVVADKLRKQATSEARKVRDRLVIEMRERLPSCYEVYPYDNAEGYFGVSAKRVQTDFKYLFAFRVVPLKWPQPERGFRVQVHGPEYTHVTGGWKRQHAVVWKARQDGSWNFESMAADVGRAYRAESGHA